MSSSLPSQSVSSEIPQSRTGTCVLCDNTGTPIIPTEIPPETRFPRTPQRQKHTPSKNEDDSLPQKAEYFSGSASAIQGNPRESNGIAIADYAEDDGDVFATPPTSLPSVPRLATSTTPNHATPPSKPVPETASRTHRPSIERTWQTERPRLAPRRSTLVGKLKRRTTASHTPGSMPGQASNWNYSNDHNNSNNNQDSDSWSSSSSDNEAVKHKGRRGKARSSDKNYSSLNVGNAKYRTKGQVSKKDGRLNISINETSNAGYIARAMGQTFKHHIDAPSRHHHDETAEHDSREHANRSDRADEDEAASLVHETVKRPRLNIVIMVIGSRGDIQPFMQIGRVLKRYGHRVRIATHPAFKEFVEKDVGLEFFSIGGNPSELMAFMVKNPGLIPKLETVRQGEIARRRSQMAEMFEGFWRACTNTTDDEKDKQNMKLLGDKGPFIADAIIANPPSFAHVHIAERLGIPLHIMFTFPYTPTQAFPHPLANIKPQKSNVDENYVNFMSYPMVEMMTWQGLGDLVNRFRVKTLGLEPVSSLWAPGALFRMKVPYTYMWSPALVSKPKDWGPEIDIAGYVFLDLATDYKPPQDLQDFLDAGEPPIYIGFGSIVVDDPDQFTKLIFDAVKIAGVRALVSKGWGGLGGDDTPDNIFMLENTPHDWLFPRCKAVVHHGGAGTCAIGLKCAKPTMIVPFFGDQAFWGAMVSSHKAGAHECIPYKQLTVEKLAEGIKQCLTDEAQENIQKLADSISQEGDGAENAVKSFHRSLPFAGHRNMRCSILEDRVAVWQLKHSHLRLSALAADMLVDSKKLKWSDLRLLRVYDWNDFDGPGEPLTGIGGALMDSGTGLAKGFGMVPIRMAKHIKKYEKHEARKKERLQKKEARQKAKDSARQHVEGKQQQDESQTRPAGPSHQDTGNSVQSTISADPEEPLAQELATDAGQGVMTFAGALASLPLDLGLAMAQGFHNAPRLYGDASVRQPVRITGMHSGAKAARNEFAYGVYDGWTGLVTQPMHGWQDAPSKVGKFTGLGKGFAKGIGGFVLKDVTAIVAPPAMLAQGVRKEVKKKVGGPGTTSFIRKAHIIQGQKDLDALREADQKNNSSYLSETQDAVDNGWRVMKQVWHEKSDYEKNHGGRMRGRWSMQKEERKWVESGALENVKAAERALEARKQGKDMEKVFETRRKELEIAQQPRASAMDQPVDYGKGSVIAPNGHFKRRPRDSDEAGEGIQKDSKHHTEVNGANTGPAVDSSGMTDIRDEDEKRQDDVKAAEDGEDASDTAVESLDEERTQPTSHTKSGEAGHDKDYRNTPAGHLNDVEIGKHDADNYAGRTAVAA